MPVTRHDDRLLADLDRALEVLEERAGVKGRVVPQKRKPENAHQPDALIDIYVDGEKHRYAVEAKIHIDRLATLGPIKAQLNKRGGRGLLFAPYITTAIARQCRELEIPFLDTAGNAYLHEPGLHVYITGEKPEDPATTTTAARGAGTATALRIIFALLCRPELLNAPYRDIVEAADVALGAIGLVFADLEKRGLITRPQKKQNRRFLEPVRLFDEWVTNYPIKLRPKLNPRRFRAENPDWWKHADLDGLPAYWGGEVAAQRLTRYLKPTTCTLYILPRPNPPKPTNVLTKLVAANRLRAEGEGDVEILDAFWHFRTDTDQPNVVPPTLAYADLIATLDPRNIEVAKMIRDQYIDDALHKA